MTNKTRRLIAVVLVFVSIFTICSIALARPDDGPTKPSTTSKPSTTRPPSSSGGSNNGSGSSGNNYGSTRPPMKDAYEALTNTSKGNGTTYGNPGVWSNGSGPGSSSSSSTSSGRGSSSSGSSNNTPTPPKPTPTRTPRPDRDDDDDDEPYIPPVTPDLAVTNITPASYRGNSTVMSTVTIQGLQAADVSSVEVSFEAGGAAQSKTVNVPANSKATVLFTWTAPSHGPVTLTATVNPARTVTETDYSNNSYSRSVTIQPPFIDAVEQPDPVPIPSRPGGENNNYVTWEETENGVTTSYWARLTLTATPSVSQLKSGYGFGVTVSANVSTNYHTSFAPTQVVMFIPERSYNEVVRLVKSGGSWTLPVSPYSPIGAQKWYVPVWFPDATTYSANVTAVGASTPGGELTATIPVNIYIDSNMYTDDSTNNTWAH